MLKNQQNSTEYWLSGPIAEIPDLLQPVAHALLQSLAEVKKYTAGFPNELLDKKPSGRASIAFHLKHLTGVIDRMLTYAKAQGLSKLQLHYLDNEESPSVHKTVAYFVNLFEEKVYEVLTYLKAVDISTLIHKRYVGRKQLPSTVIGLLFHAAEHSQRHVGQLLVTISVLKGEEFQ